MYRVEDYWVLFEPQEKSGVLLSGSFDLAASIKTAVLAVFLVFTLLFRVVGVEGSSMEPTLHEDDWLAVTGMSTAYEYGDIVVITQPWRRNVPIIKRIIAKGGDTLDIDFESGAVTRNGELLEEPYIAELTHRQYDIEFPLTVDEGCVFVMGDNRNESLDSRSSEIGLIDENYILGKAVVRFYPERQWLLNEEGFPWKS